MNTPKTVMCFGTFDLLHLGHLDYFKQAKKHGNHLIVVIARDKTKEQHMKEIIFSEQERLKLIQSLRIVDEAVLGYSDNHYQIIQEKKPDIVFLGYDHKISEKELADKLASLGLYPMVKRAEPYEIEKHKSTKLKEKILKGG